MCDSADAYVQKLSYLQLGDESGEGVIGVGRVSGSRPEAQVPVSRNPRDVRGPRPLGAIESFIEGGASESRQPPPDYKMYERENIIAASRFATPKPVEQIGLQQQQQHQSRPGQQAPVYENIEYYPQNQAHPPYYHPVESRKSPRGSPRGSVAGEAYDSGFRKAQPQVPPGNRYQTASPAKELPPYEAPPVYENIQEVHFSDSQNKPAPQVPNFYHPATINGGDYVVMTGKLGQAQRNSQQRILGQSRAQSFDGSSLTRGTCNVDPASTLRYQTSTNSDTQASRSAYVPPSELQTNRNFGYSPEQHSPRSGLPYHSESPPIRLPPEPHHYRSNVVDNTQQGYRPPQPDNGQGFRQENPPLYKQYVDSANRSTGVNYAGDSSARNSPVYNTSSRGEISACRNSPVYSSNRSNIPQNDRNYHNQDCRGDFPPRNSPIYSSNRSDQMRTVQPQIEPGEQSSLRNSPMFSPTRPDQIRISNPQNDRGFAETSETLGTRNSPIYSPSRDMRIAAPHNNSRNSPKTSPTHAQLAPDITHSSISSPRHCSTDNPVRGLVHAPVTSASTAPDDPGIHGPRITSLPPGVTSGVAGPVFLNAGVPMLQRTPEPVAHVQKSVSPPIKPSPGKGLLPYNVTPPRPSGPTEAERKIEELTRQLEEEMEKQEEEGEYFGICHTCEHCVAKHFTMSMEGYTAKKIICILVFNKQQKNVRYAVIL
ncbi:LIM domain-containing protein jub isoform X2 [Cephus cinctus]|uniref:LIM domain-containing protein jub isoform X2 n=1 Tax=Cephus cinctus TaxID=211228 RepID=A0AAJ7R8C2_CEPCN|nr:LIM domain-containing protein jub isoform X2 [Cephus cinctus]